MRLTPIRSFTTRWLAAGLDFIAPPHCPLCGRENEGVERGAVRLDPSVCASCVVETAPAIAAQCRRCAAPVGPHLDTSDGCIHCRSDRFAFEESVSLGVYADRLQSACLRAKQPEGSAVAASLAALLWDRFEPRIASWRADVVVPVPPFWMHRLFRRQNAAGTLAETLARRLRVPCDPAILAKRRWTQPQTALSPTDRRHNLKDAFRADRHAVIGKRILLVDDVMTTGTTAHRCARTLREAGAARVDVAVIARGLGKPRVAST